MNSIFGAYGRVDFNGSTRGPFDSVTLLKAVCGGKSHQHLPQFMVWCVLAILCSGFGRKTQCI